MKAAFTTDEAMILRRAYEDGVSAKLMADLHDVSAVTVGTHLRKVGTAMRPGGHGGPVRSRCGEDHSQWKGGRSVNHDGYVTAWVSPDDPMASMRHSNGRVLEHRLVMARALGRPLTENETVHHIHGDKLNNKIENLQLRNGRHGKGQASVCNSCGSQDINYDLNGV